MREPITLGELLENCRLQTSVQDTLVHRHWGIPNQVAEWRRHATPLERYQATLFCWLQHACQWMHPLFFENVANFSRPFLEELVKDRKSPARLGIVDFRWCLHLPQYHFFDLRTCETKQELPCRGCTYLYADLAALEPYLSCHDSHSSPATLLSLPC